MTLQEVIAAVLELVLVVMIPFALNVLKNYISVKVEKQTESLKNDRLKGYINSALQSIWMCVDATYQTYVQSLKAQGKFDQEAQAEAFLKARTAALKFMSKEMRDAVEIVYGDFNSWLDKTIEQLVLANKDTNKAEIIQSMML